MVHVIYLIEAIISSIVLYNVALKNTIDIGTLAPPIVFFLFFESIPYVWNFRDAARANRISDYYRDKRGDILRGK